MTIQIGSRQPRTADDGPPIISAATLSGAKRTSALRRVPELTDCRCIPIAGVEGAVCAFELPWEASPIEVEGTGGRKMMIAPGDVFLGTPGYRESTRWVVGGIPEGGLVPGYTYWVLAENGLVGELWVDRVLGWTHLGQVRYLGTLAGADGVGINIRTFAAEARPEAEDYQAPVFCVVGTSAEAGKTTAGTAVLRSLRQRGAARVTALKATGTSAFGEIAVYRDFGADHIFDCVDFGLPTTYPTGRRGIESVFDRALDACLSVPADAVVIECGGDILGSNVPVFLDCLQRRRARPTIVLAAMDALGALGAKHILDDMGLKITLVTGQCTDLPTLKSRTEALCGIPAINMSHGVSYEMEEHLIFGHQPGREAE